MPLSATDKLLLERLESDLKTNAPDQSGDYHKIRQSAMALAVLMVNVCPDRRERSLALTKLEESFLWAIAAIERRAPDQ